MEKTTRELILEKALLEIENWNMPPTGKFWDEEKTRPMSYASCYGSNGEREYVRNIARKALET